mgnify:CR=1 FL=1
MKLPSMIPPILDTPFINAVTPAPRSLPLLSPKLVDTGPVKIESISNALLESDVEIAKKVSEDLALNGPTSTCGSLITKQNGVKRR